VSVSGDIDLTTEQAFRDALTGAAANPAGRLVVDLAGVGFFASAALQALLEMNRQVKVAGGSLVVAAAQPVVARVLSLTGLDKVIPVVAGVEEALALR
jgi:anti-anti-sigma factor